MSSLPQEEAVAGEDVIVEDCASDSDCSYSDRELRDRWHLRWGLECVYGAAFWSMAAQGARLPGTLRESYYVKPGPGTCAHHSENEPWAQVPSGKTDAQGGSGQLTAGSTDTASASHLGGSLEVLRLLLPG